MKDRIFEIITSALGELNASLNSQELYNPTLETRLYGPNAALDSMSLVTLIADIEDRINTEFRIDIVLADERAMSQVRSPFGRVGALVDYIEQLLVENK
jgi:acyl carrier protein